MRKTILCGLLIVSVGLMPTTPLWAHWSGSQSCQERALPQVLQYPRPQPDGACDTGRFDPVGSRARMLHTGQGRFCQRDPLGYVDGMGVYLYEKGRAPTSLDQSGLTIIVTPPPLEDWSEEDVSIAARGALQLAIYRMKAWWDRPLEVILYPKTFLLISPPRSEGMPWSFHEPPEPMLAETRARYSILTYCECHNAQWHTEAVVLMRARILVSPTRAISIRGAYGHEQRHVDNHIGIAIAAAKALSAEVREKHFASNSECVRFGDLLRQRVNENVVVKGSVQDRDHRYPHPQNGQLYEPLGQMPDTPSPYFGEADALRSDDSVVN